ncbi:unnamed protein product [Ectocarpus sp. 12 AP-2014]
MGEPAISIGRFIILLENHCEMFLLSDSVQNIGPDNAFRIRLPCTTRGTTPTKTRHFHKIHPVRKDIKRGTETPAEIFLTPEKAARNHGPRATVTPVMTHRWSLIPNGMAQLGTHAAHPSECRDTTPHGPKIANMSDFFSPAFSAYTLLHQA